ncbi:GGDEF domain-containing protein [Methyloceanibacter sp. wino2]|uniref:GGDEF domain-containing protein n=1 Tax=Methyloceanibacter sp. wino2 TaxID=2170729 RepID=UPI00131EF160|nr:GGDEF domain-containing protein [Methyloceanibacter sp. wino2]
MAAVSVVITFVLGVLMVGAALHQKNAELVGEWGGAIALDSAGILAIVLACEFNSSTILLVGLELLVVSDSIKWAASRRFCGRRVSILYALIGPIGLLLTVPLGLGLQVALACIIRATYAVAAAGELRHVEEGRKPYQLRPTTLLLFAAGIGLSWLLILDYQPYAVSGLFGSPFFPMIILATVLLRVVLALAIIGLETDRDKSVSRLAALTDPLTGALNRRGFFEEAQRAIDSAECGGAPVAVMMLDLDNFKQINDRHGHLVGDRVLVLFASLAGKLLGPDVQFGRYGGEEFAAVLTNTNVASALDAAEAVRRAFCDADAVVTDRPVKTTVSIGIAISDGETTCLDALLRRADKALYRAKQSGRNCVEFAGDCTTTGGGEQTIAPAGRIRSQSRFSAA